MKFYPTDIDMATEEIPVDQEDFTLDQVSRRTLENVLRSGGWHRIEFDGTGLYFEGHPDGGLILQFYQDDALIHHGYHFIVRDVITMGTSLDYGLEDMSSHAAKILMDYGHLIAPAMNWLALAAKITPEGALSVSSMEIQ